MIIGSILFQKIRTRLGLAYTVTSDIELYEEGGVFIIYAGTDKRNAHKVVNKILEEVDRLGKTLIKRKDINNCLDTITGRLQLSYENGMNCMIDYGSRALFHAKIDTVDKLTRDVFIPKVMTPYRLRKIAQKYLTRKNLYISILGDHPLTFTKKLLT